MSGSPTEDKNSAETSRKAFEQLKASNRVVRSAIGTVKLSDSEIAERKTAVFAGSKKKTIPLPADWIAMQKEVEASTALPRVVGTLPPVRTEGSIDPKEVEKPRKQRAKAPPSAESTVRAQLGSKVLDEAAKALLKEAKAKDKLEAAKAIPAEILSGIAEALKAPQAPKKWVPGQIFVADSTKAIPSRDLIADPKTEVKANFTMKVLIEGGSTLTIPGESIEFLKSQAKALLLEGQIRGGNVVRVDVTCLVGKNAGKVTLSMTRRELIMAIRERRERAITLKHEYMTNEDGTVEIRRVKPYQQPRLITCGGKSITQDWASQNQTTRFKAQRA